MRQGDKTTIDALLLTPHDNDRNQQVDPLVINAFDLNEETMLLNSHDEDAYCSSKMDVTVPTSSPTMWSGRVSLWTRKCT